MKIMFDLNVFLDVLQNRKPFSDASGAVMSLAVKREIEGFVPAHLLTTMYYLLAKYQNRETALDFLDWVINHFTIVPADRQVFIRARSLDFKDFEDAVLAVSAEKTACDYILSRNTVDYKSSPVATLDPVYFLEKFF